MSWIRPVFNSPLTARSKGAKIKCGKYFHVYSINEITSSLFQLYIEIYFKKLANLLHNMVIPDYPTLTSTQYILTIGYIQWCLWWQRATISRERLLFATLCMFIYVNLNIFNVSKIREFPRQNFSNDVVHCFYKAI